MSNRLSSVPTAPSKYLFDGFLRAFAPAASSDETVYALRKLAQPMHIGRGRTVPLDPASDALVYVGDGATKLIASASSGREQIVAFHFTGDLISVPAGAWHSYALCALAETDLLVFPAESFLEIAGTEREIMDALLQRSLTALHRCRDKAVGLGRKNAQERLASFLVGMAERIGSIEPDRCLLELPMSRRDIGDSLGLTIETISRQFSELRLAGLIETTGRSRVLLCDPAALTERAGHT
ncbi:helix-turn-helix domain-containing protein [Altererythrobacter sp. ZODW24]|uniref:helix-turn-helix domain-containing protein n=1 Tax=Altererythrobacter sp. ZODW24 TaxID=2185142 RepID=UPI000DF7A668|nr:helix-turn-helix domain-containing protein [Altererythrobacter sp. ZODW24]